MMGGDGVPWRLGPPIPWWDSSWWPWPFPSVLGGLHLTPDGVLYYLRGSIVRFDPNGLIAFRAYFSDVQALSSSGPVAVHWYFGEEFVAF